MRSRLSRSAPLIVLAVALPIEATLAQEAGPSVLQPTDASLAIVPLRPVDEIDAELELVAQAQMSQRNQRMRAEAAEESSERFISATEAEIESVKRLLDLAKDASREAEELALEAEKDALEELKRFYERERDLRKAEAELAEKSTERGEAAEEALVLERELAAQRARSSGSGLSSTRQMQGLSKMEEETLKAQKDMYDRDREVADRQKQVIERRLDLFEARKRLFES